MCLDNSSRVLSLHGNDLLVESFLFLNKDEAAAKAKKRQAKERKKALRYAVVTKYVFYILVSYYF